MMKMKRSVLLRALALIICLSLCLSGQAAYALGDGDLDPVDLTEEPIEEAEPDFDTIDVSREDADLEEALPLAEDEWLLDESAELDAVAEPMAGSDLPDSMWVEATDSNGLTERISVKVLSTSSSWYTTTYTCQLYLPFNATVSQCYLSWDGGLSAKYNNKTYKSGSCPVPPANENSVTYTFSQNNKTVQFTINTYYTIWLEASANNGIPVAAEGEPSVRIDGFGTSAGNYQLYLPGNAVLENCFLSWGDDSVTATISDRTDTFSSGTCPIPSANKTLTYTFKKGSTTLASNVMIESYKGSGDVVAVFINIDESEGHHTIAEMDGDENHEIECTGRINIGGMWYTMEKIKGRGNATWDNSDDKKPYNVTVEKKINFPGIDSAKSDKWSFMAEVLDHSLMCNRSGFYLAHELGIGQDTASADVWMNGEYQGCYMVTPKTDSFVTKDGYMIEQDNYQEKDVSKGGDPQFNLIGLETHVSGWTSSYNLITVKKMGKNLLMIDGVVDESPENKTAVAGQIQSWLQDAWDAIRHISTDEDDGYNSKGKHYTEYIDIESFAKMYLMHEYVKSYDVCAGSILFHRDGQTDSDKLIAGPLWDLDNAMGSIYQNSMLGWADDRSHGDRRSAEGSFISNITNYQNYNSEYKTSIYKTLGKHADFMEEVVRQYNKYRTCFDTLPESIETMANEIRDSAMMNHNKVNDLGHSTGKNNHYYGTDTTLGSEAYKQTYRATTDSKTDWPVYAANLQTYIATRSLWFHNTYYDENYVCEHEYEAVVTPPTCTEKGYTTYTCRLCGDSYVDNYTDIIPHDYQNGACTVCGQTLLTAAIVCDGGATVTVYETKDTTGPCVENATSAHPRDGDTGMIDCSGEGQINFVVNLKPGYHVTKVTVEGDEGSYKNLKGPEDTGIENGYRITKVKGDLTITVKTDIPKFALNSLLLSDQIGVRFYMDLSGLTETERAESYMTFDISGRGTVEGRVDFDRAILKTVDDDPYYVFECYVNAIQMADTITATYHYRENESIEKTYSIKQYMETFDSNLAEDPTLYDAETIALVHSLADYGHYVQLFLDSVKSWSIGTDYAAMEKYYTESYNIEAVKSTVEEFAAVKEFNSDISQISQSLVLDSKTAIKVYFKSAEGYSGSISATVNDEPAEAAVSGGWYVVKIPGISPKLLGTTYTVSIQTDNDQTPATAAMSGISYVQAMLNSEEYKDNTLAQNAMAALYNYYQARIERSQP